MTQLTRRPQLNPTRIGKHVYLERVDNGLYALSRNRTDRDYRWTPEACRASKWITSTEARSHAAERHYELTSVFGTGG